MSNSPNDNPLPLRDSLSTTNRDNDEESTSDSLFMSTQFGRRETEIRMSKSSMLRSLNVFPIFGDKKLAEVSVNYYLYLEFFHIAIRLFFQILIFSIIAYILYYITDLLAPKEYEVHINLLFNGLYGVLAVFSLRFWRTKEVNRLLQVDMLYDSQWSEDAFSVLVEGLPLDTTKDEVMAYFNNVLFLQSEQKAVVDVIFLHDYKEYMSLKKEQENEREELEELDKKGGLLTQKEKEKQSSLLKSISEREIKINGLIKEIRDFQHFKGKVIVILATIQTQAEILRFFSPSFLQSLQITLNKEKFSHYYLRSHRILVKEIAEPHDLLYENLHYSSCSRFFRTILAYFISFLVFALALLFLASLQRIALGNWDDTMEKVVADKFFMYYMPVVTLILGSILERAYLFAQRLEVDSNRLDTNVRTLNYNIYLTFLLYVLVQVSVKYETSDLFVDQLQRLSIVSALKVFITKLVKMCFASNSLKKISMNQSNGLLTSLVTKVHDQLIQFDFMKGLSNALPPLFMGAIFLSLDPFYLLPLFMVILYGFAVTDKYSMVKQCKVFSSNSAKYLLKPFAIYGWLPILGFWFHVRNLPNTSSQGEVPAKTFENYFIFGVALLGFVISCFCPKNLHQQVKEKFEERNGHVKYSTVCKEFTSFYCKKDPLYKINIAQ